MQTIDGIRFAEMVVGGAARLKAHAAEINDLNVFPIPDGDTGDNMLKTVLGGAIGKEYYSERICEVADRIAKGMLLSARGNSGVILSQFFEGIKNGLVGLDMANAEQLGAAFRRGVAQAYGSVMTPVEGTILTVAREATEYACSQDCSTPQEFLVAFEDEAKRSLNRTPELLPALKKAGVVDSGAAGLICIIDGMTAVSDGASGEDVLADISDAADGGENQPDINAFTEDSVLEFGYCTELLVRLQNCKTDISSFDVQRVTSFLQEIGDSVAVVLNGSLLKIHVHTFTPDAALLFCRGFGEFLKVKIENMSLQHNDSAGYKKEKTEDSRAISKRKPYGVVVVASGNGVRQMFLDIGADVVVDGGQSMNPSTEDLISAFKRVDADTIFVFPNNGNVVLAAEQAARLYTESDVRVIESHTVGAGYAALSMMDTSDGDADAISQALRDAMSGAVTAEVSHCIRNAVIDGKEVHIGDYIGFVGKQLMAVSESKTEAAIQTLDNIGFSQRDICILIRGKDSSEAETATIESLIRSKYSGKEIYLVNGEQDVYDYIMIVQ